MGNTVGARHAVSGAITTESLMHGHSAPRPYIVDDPLNQMMSTYSNSCKHAKFIKGE
jgi:hypothetical protein